MFSLCNIALRLAVFKGARTILDGFCGSTLLLLKQDTPHWHVTNLGVKSKVTFRVGLWQNRWLYH